MFSIVHDDLGAAKLEHLGYDSAVITIDKSKLTPTNRVDLAVFGRSAASGWGAPSYVSFAVVDEDAPYSDPVLTPR